MRTNSETTEQGPANTVAVVDDPTAAKDQPLSLRLIAYVFLFIGVVTLLDIFLGWLVNKGVFLNLNAVLLFVGWGLFRGSPLARSVALLAIRLSIFCAVIIIGILWLASGKDWQFNIGGHPVEPTFSIRLGFTFVTGITLVILWWMLRVLSSAQVAELFAEPRIPSPSQMSRHWLRFSIGNVLFMMAVVAFFAAQIGAEERLQHITKGSENSQRAAVLLQIGTLEKVFLPNAEPELAYLVVIHGSPNARSLVRSHNSTFARLEPPDQEPIVLPSETQLFEWRDGKLHRSDLKITYSEFEKLEPDLYGQWSLENLEAAVAKLRASSDMQ